uniref:RNA replication protein n=2 Tax=root TaxID=1 RepID=A0A1D1Y587_9ARAE|nr:RdRp [Anthurium alphaflexivirus 1]
MSEHVLFSQADRITRELHLDVLEQQYLNETLKTFSKLSQCSNLHVPQKQKSLLDALHLNYNYFGSEQHPHPANKIIEEHMLFNLLAPHVDSDSELWYSKESKAIKLLGKVDSDYTITLKNKKWEAKDELRYNNDLFISDNMKACDKEILILHDAIHYYEFEQIEEIFTNSKGLKKILATTIIPPESMFNLDSIYPDLYEIVYKGDTLVYIPEGDYAGSYEQPYSALKYLMTKNFVGKRSSFTISILARTAAHHLLLITPGVTKTQDYYIGGDSGYSTQANFFFDRKNNNTFVYPSGLLFDLKVYASAIKTPSETNIRAKLRLLLSSRGRKNIDFKEFLTLANTVYHQTKYLSELESFNKVEAENLIKRWTHYFSNFVKKIFLKKTTEEKIQLIYDLVNDIEIKLNWKRIVAYPKSESKIRNSQVKVLKFFLGEKVLNNEIFYQTFLLENKLHEIFNPIAKNLKERDEGNSLVPDIENSETVSEYSLFSNPERQNWMLEDEETYELDQSISEVSSNDLSYADTISIPDVDQSLLQVRHQINTTDYTRPRDEILFGQQQVVAEIQQQQEQIELEEGILDNVFEQNFNDEDFVVEPGNWSSQMEAQETQGWGDMTKVEIEEVQNSFYLISGLKNARTYLKTALKCGRGCGLKVLSQVLGQNKLIKALERIVKEPLENRWNVGRFITNLSENGYKNFYCLTLNDIEYVCKLMEVKVNYHIYFKSEGNWYCEDNNSEFNILNYGNNHWTVRMDKHTCQSRSKLQEIKELEKKSKNRIKAKTTYNIGEMKDPDYIYFRNHDLVLPARNEFLETNFEHIKPGKPKLEELAVELKGKIEYHKPTSERADLYAREMKNGTTGTIAKNFLKTAKSIDNIVNSPIESGLVKVLVRVGRGGCRKTQAIIDYLNKKESKNINTYTVVVPRTHTRRDWNEKVNHKRKYCVKTFETALLQAPAEFVVFDEISQLPPGYIDTFLRRWTHVKEVVLLFDLVQTTFHEPNPDSVLNKQVREEAYYAHLANCYENYTFRSCQQIAKFLGYRSYNTEEGEIVIMNTFNPNSLILAADEVTSRSLQGGGHNSLTISSAQGMTSTKPVQTYLNGASARSTVNTWNTAITRATNKFSVVVDGDLEAEALEKRYEANPFLRAILGGSHFINPEVIPVKEEELAELLEDINLRTKLPVPEVNETKNRLLQDMKDKSKREVIVGEDITDQIKETENEASQLFLQHSQKDKATYELTKKKRLRFKSTAQCQRELRKKKNLTKGKLLFKNFLKGMDLDTTPVEFDKERFEVLKEEYYKKKLTLKDIKTMENNKDRSIIDDGINKINIFLKGQKVGKWEKLKSDAKAGQTIACFKDAALCTLGPIADYLYEKIDKVMPEQYWIHTRKNIRQFNKFCKKNFSKFTRCTTNDYEAYDQSQNAECLIFEVMLLEYFNIPDDLIEFYKFLKVSANTQFGNLEIMRLTGEWCTFLFNTYVNIAYSTFKFQELRLPRKLKPASAFGGDDLVIEGELTITKEFLQYGHLFALKSKLEVTDKPMFCGWRITVDGIYKSPSLLAAKLLSLNSKQDFINSITSYAIDATFLYARYEVLEKHMIDEEKVDHSTLVRMLVKAGVNFTLLTTVVFGLDEVMLNENHQSYNMDKSKYKSFLLKYDGGVIRRTSNFTTEEKSRVLDVLINSSRGNKQLMSKNQVKIFESECYKDVILGVRERYKKQVILD